MLTALVFTPLMGAIVIALTPGFLRRIIKPVALLFTLADLLVSAVIFIRFDPRVIGFHIERPLPWVPPLKIQYFLGIDGISLTMVILTTLVFLLAILVSWNIEERTKEYFAWLLVLQTGVLGVFTSLDLFLFFLFWEIELVPMYFLISIWGYPPPLGRREYSAMKFLIYTIFGSAFMLVGILAIGFSPGGSFDIVQLARVGVKDALLPLPVIFWFLFFAFAVKLPIVPLHTWLPDAHTDAPTAVSVILAGVLLKMGGYGIIRICVTLLPGVARDAAPALATLAVISVLYGAFITLRQTDLKRLIAYSSVSHMGYVLLGIASLTPIGLTGAVLQMFTHGTITGLLFALVGVIYDKTHERRIPELQGLGQRMPLTAVLFTVAGLAALGLPTLSGFVSELLVFLGTFSAYGLGTVLAVIGILLTAGYILWTVERVFHRPLDSRYEYIGDATVFEAIPLAVFVGAIVIVGIRPGLLTDVIQPGVQSIIRLLS